MGRKATRGLTLLVCLTLGKLGGSSGVANAVEVEMSIVVTSTAFTEGKPIPSTYTCDGRDLSPPLAWTDPPAGTKSFALINDDPDAPMGTWVHWVVYNLPPSVRQLPEAFPADKERPDGTRQGRTDFGRIGYGGPCPPSGTHRYVFTLYALDTVLSLAPGATKAAVEAAMQGHILAQAQLIGTYRRKGR
jgi:Raf kinase inhibitor-like YbhB/YbcL family protein